jgi:radical SAM protein with 4Fe4S-binding SPASM domain
MNPKLTILRNINRKKPILDRDPQFYNGYPLPSWIELSLIDTCNRTCSFCPKSNKQIAPNTNQKMERILIEKLSSDLKKINFDGAFCLCGYGEPLLHKDHIFIINELAKIGQVEIVTNGDTVNDKKLREIYSSSASRLLISLYDGSDQLKKFQKMIERNKIPEGFVILRDRWYSDKKDFGVKLTNRTSTVKIGNQDAVDTKRACFYTSYQTIIDWNGDVFLCPQDWQRRITMGNIMQKSFIDIWNGNILNKYRKLHLIGDRSQTPCNSCNANGMVYGEKHSKAWLELLNFKLNKVK